MRTFLLVTAALVGCGPMTTTATDAGTTCATATKSPVNVARNAEFECGDPTTEFKPLGTNSTVKSSTGRSGKGLTFTTGAGLYGNRFGSDWKVIAPAAATYCLTAWIKSTSTATTVSVFSQTPGSGAANTSQFNMPGPVTSWSKVPPNVKLDITVKAGDELTLSVDDKTNTVGTVIEVDDLDLWISADGRCNETR